MQLIITGIFSNITSSVDVIMLVPLNRPIVLSSSCVYVSCVLPIYSTHMPLSNIDVLNQRDIWQCVVLSLLLSVVYLRPYSIRTFRNLLLLLDALCCTTSGEERNLLPNIHLRQFREINGQHAICEMGLCTILVGTLGEADCAANLSERALWRSQQFRQFYKKY